MKFINADELKRKIIEGDGDDEFTEGYNFAINEIIKYIDNMPFVDFGWIDDDTMPNECMRPDNEVI